jgi:hypothetical protein
MRKDWDDKAQVGYFVGYSEDTLGWEIYLPDSDSFVTTVHVLFDEKIPARSEDYFKELDEAASVFIGADSKSVAEFVNLKGQCHVDDEDHLLYITKRVESRRGFIVGNRAQITAGEEQAEEKTPIHIADIERMTLATKMAEKKTSEEARRLDSQTRLRGNARQATSTTCHTTCSGAESSVAGKKGWNRWERPFKSGQRPRKNWRRPAERAASRSREKCYRHWRRRSCREIHWTR